jgi:hypothetical protein
MVEFIEYTGGYPALCCGELTVKIDGKAVKFGGDGYKSFWASGGSCSFGGDWSDEIIEHDKWRLMEQNLPKKYKKYAQELIDCFNQHVPQGCCGGCI